MRNRTYGGVRGRKTKVGRKLLRFPPTRLVTNKKETLQLKFSEKLRKENCEKMEDWCTSGGEIPY